MLRAKPFSMDALIYIYGKELVEYPDYRKWVKGTITADEIYEDRVCYSAVNRHNVTLMFILCPGWEAEYIILE